MDTIPQNTPQRQCTGPCGRTLPATLDYFSPSKLGKYGLTSRCKECLKEISRQYKQTHKEEVRTYKREYTRTHPGARSTYTKTWREAHREEQSIRHKEYYQAHKEELSAYLKQYNQAHKEENYINGREYRLSHPEQSRAYTKKYRDTHKEEVRTYERNRRALELNNGGTHTAKDVKEQYKRQKGKCYYCQVKFGTGKGAYHVDHIVPLTRGGSNGPENLVLACCSCNTSKGDKMLHEWHKGGRLM